MGMKVGLGLATAAFLGAALCGAAQAQAFNPYAADLPTELSAPSWFDGLYAGVIFGMSGADHKNFFPTGAIDRYGIGAALGYRHYLAPGVVIGGEVQGHLDTDFAGTWNTGLMGFAQLGFTTSDDFLVYLLAGGGIFDNVPAWAVGAGAEWGVYDNMGLRAEIITIGQAGPAPSGLSRPGISAWIIKGGPMWHFGAGSNDLPGSHLRFEPPAHVTDFDGAYAGLGYGMHLNMTANFFPDLGFGAHITRGHLGAFGGWNFKLVDGAVKLIAGVEGQADFLYDTSGDVTWDAIGLGRLGIVPFEGVMVYGAAGIGVLQNKATYALGGGIEYALWGDASLRAEVLALGELTPVGPVTAYKGTIGAVWHFD
jgi:hypothetical protein